MSTILSIAHTIVSNRSTSNGAISGPQPLVANPSAADPASNGMVVLLANWTGQGNNDGLDYAGAAQDQLNFLYVNVSKTPDGAISHRMDQLQLWFVSLPHYIFLRQPNNYIQERLHIYGPTIPGLLWGYHRQSNTSRRCVYPDIALQKLSA